MSLWGLLDQNGMLSLNSPACDLLPAASIAITVLGGAHSITS